MRSTNIQLEPSRREQRGRVARVRVGKRTSRQEIYMAARSARSKPAARQLIRIGRGAHRGARGGYRDNSSVSTSCESRVTTRNALGATSDERRARPCTSVCTRCCEPCCKIERDTVRAVSLLAHNLILHTYTTTRAMRKSHAYY